MHVGFYLNTNHLSDWDWADILQGDVPLSGTDGQTFRLAHELTRRTSVQVTLLTTTMGTSSSATKVDQVQVEDFVDAVRYADTHRFDVLVFTNANKPDVIEGLHVAEQVQQLCIAWCHTGPWSPTMWRLYAEIDAVQRVICMTHPHANLFRDRSIFDKIEVVYNGIDAEWYRKHQSILPDSHTACYVGALTPDKGFHHVAQSWPQVRKSVPDARLIVVGGANLYDRSATLGPLEVADPAFEHDHIIPYLGNSREEAFGRFGVNFRGLVSPRQIRDLMHACQIGIVNPNLNPGESLETFCISAIEFQATGTPVVGGRRRGLRETVRHKQTGLLIDTQDQLAPSICRLLTHKDEAQDMGRRGQKRVAEMFDFSHAVERWQQVLNATAEGISPNPPPFSWQRATPKTIVREGIRRLHALAGHGNRISLLDRGLEALRGKIIG